MSALVRDRAQLLGKYSASLERDLSYQVAVRFGRRLKRPVQHLLAGCPTGVRWLILGKEVAPERLAAKLV